MSEWSGWHRGMPGSIVGEVETEYAFWGQIRHRWRRYRHEHELLALVIAPRLPVTDRPGPTRPMEGA